MDLYGFLTGSIFDAHEYLGAHFSEDRSRCYFRTYAPRAHHVDLLIHDTYITMTPTLDGKFYETILEDVKPGDKYEYRIHNHHGGYVDHADPYGFGMELRPDHKSVVRDIKYEFKDQKWMNSRSNMMDKPLNIYECHVGSWRKPEDLPDSWYSYTEFAELIIPYLKEKGYNYVEFMPLCEYPCDNSWGYQNTGYFAPTSRYGDAIELKKAIEMFHLADIGVILDFVPAHFAIDDYGLRRYDGDALYEYPHYDVGISEWGSCNFIHYRGEVRSFLQSSANYWLKEYHFDGIRMDAVSRLIYWQGDEKRGVNKGAVDFIKGLNHGLKYLNKGIMLIAEDSTNYPKVTVPVEYGGLGFDYKWDLGWMHDTLEFLQSTPNERVDRYHKLTFSMMYFYNENYLLPLSHDEVVHGKATILQRMCGLYEGKFPQARSLYMYMMMHPGKKLLFMGSEFGQLREWDEEKEQDWLLLKYPNHDAFLAYMKELNNCYQNYDAFWKMDYENNGFMWLDCNSNKDCLYAIVRNGHKSRIMAAFNFREVEYKGYSFQADGAQKLRVILHSDWYRFGGNTPEDEVIYEAVDGRFSIDLPAYGSCLLEVID